MNTILKQGEEIKETQNIQENQLNDICTICLGEVKECQKESEGVMTECKHIFHAKCFLLYTQNSKGCPNCRKTPVTILDLDSFIKCENCFNQIQVKDISGHMKTCNKLVSCMNCSQPMTSGHNCLQELQAQNLNLKLLLGTVLDKHDQSLQSNSSPYTKQLKTPRLLITCQCGALMTLNSQSRIKGKVKYACQKCNETYQIIKKRKTIPQ